MIQKMNKYAFLVYHREYNDFLLKLRELGVVHIKETHSIAEHQHLQSMLALHQRIRKTVEQFDHILNQKDKKPALMPAYPTSTDDMIELLDRFDRYEEQKSSLKTTRTSLEKDIKQMETWGDFDFDNLCKLEKAGYVVSFYTCSTSTFDPAWVEEYNAIEITNVQSETCFITITPKGTVMEIDAEAFKLPDCGLRELQQKLKQCDLNEAKLQQNRDTFAVEYKQTLIEFNGQLENDINFTNAKEQTSHEAGEMLMVLEGYILADKTETMEKILGQAGYYYQPLTIEENENIPIELKNNKFAKLFEPITKLFSLPNYSELDLTAFFAPFFMLFFGLCFGDGGYGILIIIACAILKKKVKPDIRPFLTLFQFFGLAALIVACFTGSFFGLELGKFKVFEGVKDYFLTQDNLMILSIVIGITQIIVGKSLAVAKVIKQKGFKYGVAPLAWVIVIVCGIAAIGLPLLGIQLPERLITILYGIAAIGILVAFLYNRPGKNILINFGNGIWNTYNMATGLLSDTLSYIRLFAIGLTGSILGGVFNTLAVTMTDGMNVVVRFIVMLLILLVGHSLNFALCSISSLVHPLRLTYVEFYNNAEFEGGGKAYKPFKKA